MSVLSDVGIVAALEQGLRIEPFVRSAVQPASYDCMLGTELLFWPNYLPRDPRQGSQADSWRIQKLSADEVGPYWRLHPGTRYLTTTAETITLPPHLAAQISARSSWGRDGLDVIQGPAGWLDPGYRGKPTLELSVTGSPLVIWPGAPCLQLVFFVLDQPAGRPYAGRYQNDVAPTPAREEGVHRGTQ